MCSRQISRFRPYRPLRGEGKGGSSAAASEEYIETNGISAISPPKYIPVNFLCAIHKCWANTNLLLVDYGGPRSRMSNIPLADVASNGAAFVEQLVRLLEEERNHRRQLEERLQRIEERVILVEESLSRALSNVMPKVDELLSRYGGPVNAVSPPTEDGACDVAASSSSNSCERAETSSTTASAQGTRPANAPGCSTPSPMSLHEAATQGDMAALERMLAAGGRMDARDKQGNTALHVAAAHGHMEAVNFLIAKGALVDRFGQKARTPLHFAAAGGHLSTVERLLTAGATVDVIDADGYTALARAAAGGYLDVVQHLCEEGASLDVVDANGCSPLYHAAKGGHLSAVTYFLGKGVSPKVANKKNETPIFIAAQNVYGSVLAEMLKTCSLQRAEMRNLLLVAGSAEVVWLILDIARDDVLGTMGEEALRRAAADGRLEVIEALLQVGVSVNATAPTGIPNCVGTTALHNAAENGHISCVLVLLQAGANPNKKHNTFILGKALITGTALHSAASAGHAACVRELLQGGADKSIANGDGHTALSIALAKRNSECVRLLQ